MHASHLISPAIALSLAAAPLAVRGQVASDPGLGLAPPGPPPLEDIFPAPATPLAAKTPAANPNPSTNMAVNLVALLVKKGQLTQEEGLALIDQAESETKAAQAAAASAAPPTPPPVAEGDVRVTYVPQTVRNNIRDEIKQELLADAVVARKKESAAPEWTSRIRPFGDFRARYEGIFFAGGNDNTGSFPNFNTINNGAPFDTAGTLFSPQYNVDKDRNRARMRARVGADILLGGGFTAGLRLATGESSSPVSPNQSLGSSGGDFSKYAIWLDRAFLGYNLLDGTENELSVLVGRFDNPFFSTEVMWDEDLGFDGLALKGRYRINDRLAAFYAGGAFPVYNTDYNFSSNQPSKFSSEDKWLLGAQLGVEWKIKDDLKAKLGVAYYDFENIEGRLSTPFTPLNSSDAGNTDATRPSFAQRGNTYRALRDIVPTAANGNGTLYQYQYYGLATPFRILTATGRLDYTAYDPVNFAVIGEISKNLAFDSGDIGAVAVNNRIGAGTGSFDGGDLAWNVTFQFGRTALDKPGDWAGSIGYRYVESDAVVDGFTDSEFGGGATNIQGFTLGATLAVTPNVRLGVKWMSSDEVTGPPLGMDTLQFDINAKF